MGDKVYYKRMDCPEWKGPGIVIGQDGEVVFVRHGGTCIRVHHLRLRKVNTEGEHQLVTHTGAENDVHCEQGQEFDYDKQETGETLIEVQQGIRQLENTGVTSRVQSEAEHHT